MCDDELFDAQLLHASQLGDADKIKTLIDQGADPSYQNIEGVSPLMMASSSGNSTAVTLLLEAGAPWNATDSENQSAAEYASGSGHPTIFKQLLDFAVRAELLLGTAARKQQQQQQQDNNNNNASNQEYLEQGVEYTEDGDTLIDQQGDAVMMEWERELMQKHADILCTDTPSGRAILNVGFGMGIIDTEIQNRIHNANDHHSKDQHTPLPSSIDTQHHIIEGHPMVYKKMIEDGWDKKAGVSVHFGRWQDVIPLLSDQSLDSIFFDTFGEYYDDMREFHSHIPRLLKPGGVYSYFNGLAADQIFYHLVSNDVARLELGALGFEVSYEAMPMKVDDEEIWKGVKSRYWRLPVYFVPICILKENEGGGNEKEDGEEEG
jgi:protein arginine N-methyltransferase 2